HLLDQTDARIDGKAFNAGSENLTLLELAVIVQSVVGDGPPIKIEPTDDLDSYHVSSDRLRRELEFEPSHTIEDAISNLAAAFRNGKILEPVDNPKPVNTETAHQ
ncbi:MAG TPA: SDR family NAD-dependent epimerase/dehydratase, partial [Rhodospirillales bacterium]|nr:SDR family NAD-dependent epimerase/dehydratase [Rhodospirillales bacterium]